MDHDSLLRKLYLDGISGDDWLLMKDLYGSKVAADDQTVHLGVHRHIKCTRNMAEKINLGHRTAYSLMGDGFHGKSGLRNPSKPIYG